MKWLTRLTAAVRLWWRQQRCTHTWVPDGGTDWTCAVCGTARGLGRE